MRNGGTISWRGVAVLGLLLATAGAGGCGDPDRNEPDRSGPAPDSSTAGSTAAATANPREVLIESNVLNLAQYVRISKFRSCEGHDFSGLNVDGEPETMRSMKHYLEVDEALANSTGKLVAYAPFDGRIERLEADQRGQRIGVASTAHPQWTVLFFHTDAAPGIAVGQPVTRGQVVGHGNLTGSHNFDVALRWSPGGNSQEERWDSILPHMSEAVLAEYRRKGLSPDNLVISKAARDAKPCQKFARSDDNWTPVR